MKAFIHVVAVNLVDMKYIDPEDQEVPGVYQFEIDEDLKDSVIEDILDVFHDKQGIDNLEDFEILVVDLENERVIEDLEDETDSVGSVEYLGKVDDTIPEFVINYLNLSQSKAKP